ncbi:MAG: hypothetical protein AB1801_23965 [Chloroflexota bacterium]
MNKWLKIGGMAVALVVGVAVLGITAYSLMPAPANAKVAPRLMQQAMDVTRFDQPQAEFGSITEFGFPGGAGRFGDQIDYDALLADALGITVEELQAARQQADTAAVQQALDKGLITQDEADLMSARIQLKNYLDREALTAKALGITPEALQAARDEGKPLAVLIYELGLQPATVRANMQTAFAEAMQQAVTDGVITQDQADQLQNGPGFGFGGFHGRGGFGGPGGFGGFGKK